MRAEAWLAIWDIDGKRTRLVSEVSSEHAFVSACEQMPSLFDGSARVYIYPLYADVDQCRVRDALLAPRGKARYAPAHE